MSPLRSSAGPGDRADADAELLADDVRERSSCRARAGPTSRTWSSASPRAFAASSAIASCSLTRSWPTKSSSAPRPERALDLLLVVGVSAGARNWLAHAASCSACAHALLGAAAPGRRRRARARRRPATSRARRARRGRRASPASPTAASVGSASPSFSFSSSTTRCAVFLPMPGDRLEARGVARARSRGAARPAASRRRSRARPSARRR